MILYIINLHEVVVWSSHYINEIDLYALKETYRYNALKRTFRLAVGLMMTGLIYLD